jgi:hypothetical protein
MASTKTKPEKKPVKKPKPPVGFRTLDYGDGMHGLLLLGSGYAWESIARHVAKQLKITRAVTFDCEGSMFVARAADAAVLAKLRASLEPIRLDRAEFKRLVTKLGER